MPRSRMYQCVIRKNRVGIEAEKGIVDLGNI